MEILTTTLFAEALQVMTDIFLDLKYDLYGYFHKGVDAGGLMYCRYLPSSQYCFS
jgi:hypothetical protein